MQLGIVTYNIAHDWDLPTILARLEALGYAGVELRTGHAHKGEVHLTQAQRDEVHKRFQASPVQLAGLGSAFEYHARDPAVVRSACWKSNATDVIHGSVQETFALVASQVREVHLHDLFDTAYPWSQLFTLLDA